MFRHFHTGLRRQRPHLPDPQPIASLRGALHFKSVDGPAPDLQQTGPRPQHFFQRDAGADGLEGFGGQAGAMHFSPPSEGDDAKACALAFAFANHLQVAQLEDLQGQQGPWEDRRAQWKQGQGLQV